MNVDILYACFVKENIGKMHEHIKLTLLQHLQPSLPFPTSQFNKMAFGLH